jgi:molybdopterin synthase catalytic subunit
MIARIITDRHETITLDKLMDQIKESPILEECGALFSFEGIVRGKDKAKNTEKLILTTPNPEKTEEDLKKIIGEVKEKYGVKEIGVVHYLGQFQPRDPLFLAVVAGAHRHESMAALEEIIERVKFELDFKKEEEGSAGTNIIMSGG